MEKPQRSLDQACPYHQRTLDRVLLPLRRADIPAADYFQAAFFHCRSREVLLLSPRVTSPTGQHQRQSRAHLAARCPCSYQLVVHAVVLHEVPRKFVGDEETSGADDSSGFFRSLPLLHSGSSRRKRSRNRHRAYPDSQRGPHAARAQLPCGSADHLPPLQLLLTISGLRTCIRCPGWQHRVQLQDRRGDLPVRRVLLLHSEL